jgi:hypothetical protein
MVIVYNVLNNVEPKYLADVCEHISSLVARDLILAIVVSEDALYKGLDQVWINKFPDLKLSYACVGQQAEDAVGLTGKHIKFKTMFIWMYRQLEEVVPPQPRIRVKKNKPV